jgi:hypothetical protein
MDNLDFGVLGQLSTLWSKSQCERPWRSLKDIGTVSHSAILSNYVKWTSSAGLSTNKLDARWTIYTVVDLATHGAGA